MHLIFKLITKEEQEEGKEKENLHRASIFFFFFFKLISRCMQIANGMNHFSQV